MNIDERLSIPNFQARDSISDTALSRNNHTIGQHNIIDRPLFYNWITKTLLTDPVSLSAGLPKQFLETLTCPNRKVYTEAELQISWFLLVVNAPYVVFTIKIRLTITYGVLIRSLCNYA